MQQRATHLTSLCQQRCRTLALPGNTAPEDSSAACHLCYGISGIESGGGESSYVVEGGGYADNADRYDRYGVHAPEWDDEREEGRVDFS